MSQHHAAPDSAESKSDPIKTTIAVAVGAMGLIVGIILLAGYAINGYVPGSADQVLTPEAAAKATADRLAPVAISVVDPTKGPVPSLETALAAAKPAVGPIVAMAIPAPLPAGATAAKPVGGKGVYEAVCTVCHASGLAGAPKQGDKGAWAPRIAKGVATLYGSVLNGLGAMPAKGGNASIADEDIKAAVDYMIAQSK